MKKKCLLLTLIIKSLIFWNAFTLLIGLGGSSQKIWASTEMDRRYTLETIGYLRAWDNVDGLFSDYVSFAYVDYFSKRGEFVFQDLSKADSIFSHSKLPYHKIIEDPEVLGKLARQMRVESVIRTKIYKEGSQYRFTLDWLHAPKMEILSSDSFVLENSEDQKAFEKDKIKEALQKSLDRLFHKIPFLGRVTGREAQTVTVNINFSEHLKKGDVLVISTLEEAKIHPLLRSIVDWRLIPVGQVEVQDVDGFTVFGQIIQEEPGRKIYRFQKVTQMISKPISEPSLKSKEEKKVEAETFKLGWAAGNFWLGKLSRDATSAGGSSGKTGGGTFLGVKIDGQLWLTSKWFSEAQLGLGTASISQQDISGGGSASSSLSTTVFRLRLDGGYSFFLDGDDFYGAKIMTRLGYQITSYSLPGSSTELSGPISWTGFFVGLGGVFPLQSSWGVQFDLDLGLLKGAKEMSYLSADASSSSDIALFLGGYYQFNSKLKIRGGLDFISQGANFSNGATISQKMVNLAPALLYYF